jgi:L-serine dehydratase
VAHSIFDLFRIGTGPSSSHTVGPMRAAAKFVQGLDKTAALAACARVEVRLYGSLAETGKGHATDAAILLGLLGAEPDSVDPDGIAAQIDQLRRHGRLLLHGQRAIPFDEQRDLLFMHGETLPHHSNGMQFSAFGAAGDLLSQARFYSTGGGFIVREEELARQGGTSGTRAVPLEFKSGRELLALAAEKRIDIAGIVRTNERTWRDGAAIDAALDGIWRAMQECVARGCRTRGPLPGGLQVQRRAPDLLRELESGARGAAADPLAAIDWINLFAMAVNEENAAGGRVVTAPTNGAAGIIPAVLHYYTRFVPRASAAGVREFLLTAGAIGLLFKENASISGAEVGCQGEVGVACSMAAAGLAAVLGGSPAQVENAAEIGMEHNLGLTCDPVGGRVQIPCIERNAIGAVKALNAARMALRGNGTHHVSLDSVIKTMRETGRDMMTKYKETSLGGLAVNVVEC